MAQQLYLITEELATSIWTALQNKYSEASGVLPPLSTITGASIPTLISGIQGGQQGDTVSPITMAGGVSLNTVWLGTSVEYNSIISKSSTTLYLITG